MYTWKQFMSMREVCLEEIHASLAGIYIGMHFSQTRISYRHTSLLGICTSLLGVHLSLACISLNRASYFCVSHRRVSYRGVYFTGRASQRYTSHGRAHLPGCAHLMGVSLSRASLHLIGAYISQGVHLRCVYCGWANCHLPLYGLGDDL
jgi:hypothetical protein